ncbi:NAD(P)-dependent oxidoreductase [Kineosporia babensis]|uniref:SDR family oxidoreductase n=1 Tax=Kineosporia babensis TaxID=499548 RepID=A0A9X1T2L9_9ACTN|nr:NAD(P)H-binding protein [Kineosporia babensis]MCD5314773.1 SDR family oxidoreductase [Kineosporia babensis]
MRIAVLGATGAVGSLVVQEALRQGLLVTALARDPRQVPARPNLTVAEADVFDAASIARAINGSEVLISTLGGKNVLKVGAEAVVSSGIDRIVWLGAHGTGESAQSAGWFTRSLLSLLMRSELADKEAADRIVLAAGGTALHVGPMNSGPAEQHTLPLESAPRTFFPSTISRSAVAVALVEEAVQARFPGQTVVAFSQKGAASAPAAGRGALRAPDRSE